MSKKIELGLLAKSIKAILGQDKNIKILNGKDNIQVKENDILIYDDGNQFYFYKVTKEGSIKIPTEEYCEKLILGEGGLKWEEFKKKMQKITNLLS